MKKFVKVLIIIVILLVVLMVAAVIVIPRLGLPEEEINIEVGEIDLTTVEDGTYSGDYTAGLVSVSLTVNVKNHIIIDISIDKHDNGLGKKAEKIVDDIIASQSLDVDAISGATISSDSIRKAVEIALSE